jgi:hypothetical protein
MDQNYIDLLKSERDKMVKEHTRLVILNCSTLAGDVWKSVKRLNKEIKRAERTSRWWD